MRVCTPLVVLVLLGRPAVAATAASGQYGALWLVVRDGRVSGVYDETRMGNGKPGAPQFSCIFMMAGRLAGGQADVLTWFPGDPSAIPGRLTLSANKAAFTLQEDHDGCTMTTSPMKTEPYQAERTAPGAGWLGVSLVMAPHAAFRRAPGMKPPQRPYAVLGDAVVILARRSGWVKARYVGGDGEEAKPVEGWLPAGDLAAQSPPGPARP